MRKMGLAEHDSYDVEATYTLFGVTIDDTKIYYSGGFFVTLFGSLLSLMGYNLLKMFGVLDEINSFTSSLIDWFMTPAPETTNSDGTAEGES